MDKIPDIVGGLIPFVLIIVLLGIGGVFDKISFFHPCTWGFHWWGSWDDEGVITQVRYCKKCGVKQVRTIKL